MKENDPGYRGSANSCRPKESVGLFVKQSLPYMTAHLLCKNPLSRFKMIFRHGPIFTASNRKSDLRAEAVLAGEYLCVYNTERGSHTRYMHCVVMHLCSLRLRVWEINDSMVDQFAGPACKSVCKAVR